METAADRFELDRRFAEWLGALPDGALVVEEPKRRVGRATVRAVWRVLLTGEKRVAWIACSAALSQRSTRAAIALLSKWGLIQSLHVAQGEPP